jgi:hypothetical protein
MKLKYKLLALLLTIGSSLFLASRLTYDDRTHEHPSGPSPAPVLQGPQIDLPEPPSVNGLRVSTVQGSSSAETVYIAAQCQESGRQIAARVHLYNTDKPDRATGVYTSTHGFVATALDRADQGECLVRAESLGYEDFSASSLESLIDTTSGRVLLEMKPCRFATIRAVDTDGNPIPGQEIKWNTSIDYPPEIDDVYFTCISNPEGIARCPANEPVIAWSLGMDSRGSIPYSCVALPQGPPIDLVIGGESLKVSFIDHDTELPISGIAARCYKGTDLSSSVILAPDSNGGIFIPARKGYRRIELIDSMYTLIPAGGSGWSRENPLTAVLSADHAPDASCTIRLERRGFALKLIDDVSGALIDETATVTSYGVVRGVQSSMGFSKVEALRGCYPITAAVSHSAASLDGTIHITAEGYGTAKIGVKEIHAAMLSGFATARVKKCPRVNILCVDNSQAPIHADFAIRCKGARFASNPYRSDSSGIIRNIPLPDQQFEISLLQHDFDSYAATTRYTKVINLTDLGEGGAVKIEFDFKTGSILISECPTVTTSLIALGVSGVSYDLSRDSDSQMSVHGLLPEVHFVGPAAVAFEQRRQYLSGWTGGVDLPSLPNGNATMRWRQEWMLNRPVEGNITATWGRHKRELHLFAIYTDGRELFSIPGRWSQVPLSQNGYYFISSGLPKPTKLLLCMAPLPASEFSKEILAIGTFSAGDSVTINFTDRAIQSGEIGNKSMARFLDSTGQCEFKFRDFEKVGLSTDGPRVHLSLPDATTLSTSR